MLSVRLITSVAAFTLTATLANAADMPAKARPVIPPVVERASGYVEVYGGWASTRTGGAICELGVGCFEDFSDRFRGGVLGGAGRGNYWISPNMSVQLDAQAEGTSYRVTDGPDRFNVSNHSYLIGGHINWRDLERGLLGVFAGAGDAGGGFNPAQRHAVFGGEAQLYWNQFTFYVQGGYDTTVGTGPFLSDVNAWFVRGTGRYFLTPNTLLEGTVLYAKGEVEFSSVFGPPVAVTTQDFHTWLWEAKLEHRFAATPFSGFVKYRSSETKYDTLLFGGVFNQDFKVTDHRVLVGLRLYMGENTLQSNDRHGATLDIIDPLGVQSGPLMFVPPPPILPFN
jgi:hypothetical protein